MGGQLDRMGRACARGQDDRLTVPEPRDGRAKGIDLVGQRVGSERSSSCVTVDWMWDLSEGPQDQPNMRVSLTPVRRVTARTLALS